MKMGFASREGKAFDLITPGAMYESSIQNLVHRNAKSLFPEHLAIKIDPYFETAAGDVQPDIVLIRIDGTGWGLVEVEVEGHSWTSHILPQLSKLKRATSTNMRRNDLKKIETKFLPEIDQKLLTSALEMKPDVYLAIHGSSISSRDRLSELEVHTHDLTIYSSPPNDYILLSEPSFISPPILRSVANRHANPMFRNFWIIRDQHLASTLAGRNSVLVEAFDERGYWTYTVTGEDVLLSVPSTMLVDASIRKCSVEYFETGPFLKLQSVVE